MKSLLSRCALAVMASWGVVRGAWGDEVTNGILTVEYLPMIAGQFTIKTGPSHPRPDERVFYPLGTSYTTLRDATDSRMYANVPSFAAGLGGYATEFMGSYPFTVATLGTNGFRTTVNLPGLDVVQDVVVEGSSLADTRVRHTTSVTNTTGTDRQFGLRYMWDWQIGDNDASFFKPRDPDGAFTNIFAGWTPPTFKLYEEVDDVANPLFSVFGTVRGIALPIPPTAPEHMRYCSWPYARSNAWDFANGGGWDDSAVCYYWGYLFPMTLAPGETRSFTQYVTTEYTAIAGELTLKKVSSPPVSVGTGGDLSYVISWGNIGNGTLPQLTMTDTMPAGVFYRSSTLDFFAQSDDLGTPALLSAAWSGSWSGPWTPGEPADGTGGPLLLRWVVERIAPGRTGYIAFGTRVSCTLPDGVPILNSVGATIFGDDVKLATSTVTSASAARLALGLSGPAGCVKAGMPFTYTISYANTGNDTVTGASIWDTIPAGLLYVSSTGGAVVAGSVVSWSIPSLPPGGAGSFVLTVTSTGYIRATAPSRAAAAYGNSCGVSQPPVQTAPVTVSTCFPELVLAKKGPEYAFVGDGVEFTIVVRNAGTDTALSVLLVDTVPLPLTLAGFTGSATAFGPVIAWYFGDLVPGESREVRVSCAGHNSDQDYDVRNEAFATYAEPSGVPTSPLTSAVTVAFIPFTTLQAYPNPFKPGESVRGTFKFVGLPDGAKVHIYAVTGREVRVLDGVKRRRLEWDGRNSEGTPVAAGIYLYLLEIPEAGKTRLVRGKLGLIR
jgi:uncharacterized repeat protein (TIGR01451 family)